ncbi:hypothetical protein Ahy_B05g077635 isoform A [Arachis hypogaea]|uniref:Cyclin C-terminal domain-containing protein n=1 Tax=Arachis hypogaea TaxID=3818 RepID=A0A444Z594_ARAHY|nr:hypothetical protein Ahy_B05g077635 isoform A [Arachis hypogaea]
MVSPSIGLSACPGIGVASYSQTLANPTLCLCFSGLFLNRHHKHTAKFPLLLNVSYASTLKPIITNLTLEHYTNYKASDLETVVLALVDLQLNTKASSLNAICEKYKQHKSLNFSSALCSTLTLNTTSVMVLCTETNACYVEQIDGIPKLQGGVSSSGKMPANIICNCVFSSQFDDGLVSTFHRHHTLNHRSKVCLLRYWLLIIQWIQFVDVQKKAAAAAKRGGKVAALLK